MLGVNHQKFYRFLEVFRKEVYEAQRRQLFGSVIVTQPISIYSSCALIFAVFLIILIFLSQATYSRKETVKGYLLPERGVVKVFSDRVGVIESLYVKEGDLIQQGEALLKVKNSQSLPTGVELSVALSKEISNQIESLENEYLVTTELNEKELVRLNNQKKQLSMSLSTIRKAKKTSLDKINLKNSQLLKNKKLFENGYITSNSFELIQEDYFEVLEAHARQEMEEINIQSNILQLNSELISLPEKLVLKQTDIKRKISSLKAQVMELNNQYEFIKKAPEAGIITSIQPTLGTRVDANTPLLSIVPLNSPLEIELLLPTRSAGFIQIEDRVNIRFDAFPYQKFGFVIGKISNVDKVLILPTDKVLPIKINEAMYRVRATLNQQSIHAYNKDFPLKVGMIADADIILEKRSLLEWLLDPIYAIKGKLG